MISSATEAKAWLRDTLGASEKTMERLHAYVALVTTENRSQNLVAATTLGDAFWVRHIADSAQLLSLVAREKGGRWVDLGSGPGLPGLVVALLAPTYRLTLIEDRAKRCAFLRDAAQALRIEDRVTVVHGRVEAQPPAVADIISARAFAPLQRLIAGSRHLSGPDTIWLLPKGENAVNELSTLPPSWQKRFHVEPSITHSAARILVGSGNFAS